MANSADVLWFKTQFQALIEPELAGTPLTVDFIAAIACQETGFVWATLRSKQMNNDKILALCVGDTLDDNKGRSAFPRNKAELMAAPRGAEMFDIAHQALVDMAEHIPGFAEVAKKPNKFCHGFGMFQRDLQFFKGDPDYFLQRRYERFEETLGMCIAELKRALKKLGLQTRPTLSELELAAIGIAYNTGGFSPKKGLRQGHFDGSRFYGEKIFDFIRLAQTVALPGVASVLNAPAAGIALIPAPSPVTAQGEFFKVDTTEGMLRLRSEPRKSEPIQANVIGHLPDGHPVRAVTDKARNGFREVETSLAGALLRGFASQKFLVSTPAVHEIPVVTPAQTPPHAGVIAVSMPRKPGRVTKRTDTAGAHSLNEPDQPTRQGTTPDELRTELAAIIKWLAVDKTSNKRFQPREGLTFCNIYCHDYCHLAGVYLPRVWWTAKSVIALSKGSQVEPLIGDTIVEMRANDLFRWLRDFGAEFGWRQTGTLSKLQQAANQGAIGLIVARRKEDGKSGHIVAVVPEVADFSAKRDAAGDVTAPLQSQAGAKNFSYGTGKANWWNGDEFAESAFWVHA
ncbi:hypothetical protein NVV94_12750 [Pseudomonas sp. LS1212]|uniref:hypothetical protein n=1 Tax=Pseudomonas sp. LS1212 TaxID=2972478 RepID=UPI00215C8B0F|nr:hypothetical protein [Pseudomonas sp. LS1212]UVJ46318.1 hypothetical protein NVV94_12750 [Pseudomonas sp. LS1212]